MFMTRERMVVPLCYSWGVNRHRLAEERSLAFHRAVAEKIRVEPALLDVVRQRVAVTLAAGGRSAALAGDWREVLSRPLDDILEFLVDEGEKATELRQATPFAGIIDPRARWRIWRAVRDGIDATR